MDPHTNVDVLQLRVEEENYWQQSQDHEVELCQTLRLQVEDLQKRLEEKDNKLTQANEVIRALRDEVQTLQQQLEQHRRKYSDDAIGKRDQQCQCGRGNGITLTRTVLSDCRPSEPESGSSEAGTSHKEQNIASQNPPLCPPLATNIALKPEGSGIPTNILLSHTAAEDDPGDVPVSPQEVEDDPADVPTSPGDDTLTSSDEEEETLDFPLILADGTLIRVKSQRQLNQLQGEPSGTEKRKECECAVCGKILANIGTLREHLRVHTGERPYTCTQCDKTFKQRSSFVAHQNVHRGEKPYACAQCGMTFTSSSNLRAHQKKHHTQENPSDAEKRKNFECHECGKILSSKLSLDNHLRLHTGERPFACTQCDKAFKQKTALSMHKKLHTGERPHPCTQCGKAFRTSFSLRAHQERLHAQNADGMPNIESNKSACDVCGKILRKESLSAHKRMHTGTGCQCDVCGMIIVNQSSLLRHKLIHTGEKPHACTLCGKTFRYKPRLERHQKHHVYATEGPYKCSACHMEFKTPGYLKRHARRKHTAE